MSIGLRRLGLLATAAAALGFIGPEEARAQARDLFSPARPSDLLASASRPDEGAAREALLALNPGALVSGAPIRLRLAAGVDATFAPKSVGAAFGGGSIWTGASAGGTATLVVSDGGVVGTATFGAKTYRIERVAGGLHKAFEVVSEKLPSEGPLVPAPGGVGEAPTPEAFGEPEAGETNITVLVAYTKRAADAAPNIRSDINLAVSLANQAYATSDARIKLTLVGVTAVQNYDESKGAYGQVLQDVTQNAAAFAPVNLQRDRLRADLVSVVIYHGASCGLAWYIANPRAATAGYGYSTITRACISQHSFAHELGHNMGLNHDRYSYSRQVGSTPPRSQYNFGFSRISARKRSIMSYGDECILTAGVSCVRINAFSDPKKSVGGKPFGIVQGQAKAADNARRLRETRAAIASYR